jgi:hypothetical protein
MIIADVTTHQRTVSAKLDERELHAILANHVALVQQFPLSSKTRVRIRIEHKDQGGCIGFEDEAEISLTNDLEPPAPEGIALVHGESHVTLQPRSKN